MILDYPSEPRVIPRVIIRGRQDSWAQREKHDSESRA